MLQAKLKNKDINFLDVYKKKSEPSKYTPILKIAALPVVGAIIITSIFGYLTFSNYQLKKSNEKLNNQITKINSDIATDPNLGKSNNLLQIQNNTAKYKKMYDNVQSYPQINQTTFDQLIVASGVSVEITALSYTMDSSVITLQIEAEKANDTELFVRRLKATNEFADVQYSGYSEVEKSLMEAVNDLDAALNSDPTQPTTYKVYTATVLCTMK